MAFAACRVTIRAVIVESFFDDRRIRVRANSFQKCPITALCRMQTACCIFRNLRVASPARLLRVRAGVSDNVLVRTVLLRRLGVTAMTRNAA